MVGGYCREDASEWREIGHDGKWINTFQEVAATKDFTELLDPTRSGGIWVRLYTGKVDLKTGRKGKFALYREGDWVTPESPIIAKAPDSLRTEPICLRLQALYRELYSLPTSGSITQGAELMQRKFNLSAEITRMEAELVPRQPTTG
jgi:hypothetical protein